MSGNIAKKPKNLFKIGIVGHGNVGRAIACGLAFVADIKIYDKYYPVDELETVVNESEFIFICVPTPTVYNVNYVSGGIDLSIVSEVMEKIAKIAGDKRKIVIIKSTVVPGTTTSYQAKYPHLDFVANPEFLTERTALLDFINPSRIILGGKKSACERVKSLYLARLSRVPVFITTPEGAELAKYTSNSFFATKIGFFNEIYQLCQKIGLDYNEIKEMVLADGRIGNSHMDVPGHDGELGWSGRCFPKDTEALCHRAEAFGVDLKILKTVIKSNKEIRRS